MANGNSDTRPLSPHLQVWRWHPTMLSSILHRVSGIGNYLGAIALTAWLVMLATGTEGCIAFLFAGPMEWVTRIGLILLTWSISFHFLNGLRHLAWDAGKGFDPKGSNQRSVMIIAGSIILPAILWFFLLTGGVS